MKYTDEQIKQGLWRCSYQEKVCPHCHFQENGKNCKEILMKNALDLINRQEAEIERLKQSYLDYEETSGLKWARAEAVKKFAERVKAEMYTVGFGIDNLVEEMVGDD